jgi:hypothetical protein
VRLLSTTSVKGSLFLFNSLLIFDASTSHRLRTASPEVIKLLIESEANVASKMRPSTSTSSNGLSALSVLLFNAEISCTDLSSDQDGGTKEAGGGVKSRKCWLLALEALVKGGASWEPSTVLKNGMTQLSYVYALFPPPVAEVDLYVRIIGDAIDAGFDLTADDSSGKSSLFILCERMACTSVNDCQDVSKIINAVISHYGGRGFGGADRQGKGLLDIEDRVSKSCFSACKKDLSNAIANSKRSKNDAACQLVLKSKECGEYCLE